MSPARIRDQALLDVLEKYAQRPFQGRVWRCVAEGRDPTHCRRSGGRWDDRTFDVLYTAEQRSGALSECRYYLFQGQPIPPSRKRYRLFELEVRLQRVVSMPTLDDLARAGLAVSGYGRLAYAEREQEYPSTQAIAEACHFLGADGLRIPGARHDSANLVIFCEQDTRPSIEIALSHGVVDLTAPF